MLEPDIRIGFIVANNQLQLAAKVAADFVDFIDGNLGTHAGTVAHVGRTAGQREYQPDLDGAAVSGWRRRCGRLRGGVQRSTHPQKDEQRREKAHFLSLSKLKFYCLAFSC